MTLQNLHAQLLSLSPQEKIQAIQLLMAHLNGTWNTINKLPDASGDAFIGETGIAVWFLVNRHNQGTTDADLLAEYPDLTAVDLANAWLYNQLYPNEIKAAVHYHATNLTPDLDDDPTEAVLSDLKQSWQEAQSGNTIPLAQMWDGIDV